MPEDPEGTETEQRGDGHGGDREWWYGHETRSRREDMGRQRRRRAHVKGLYPPFLPLPHSSSGKRARHLAYSSTLARRFVLHAAFRSGPLLILLLLPHRFLVLSKILSWMVYDSTLLHHVVCLSSPMGYFLRLVVLLIVYSPSLLPHGPSLGYPLALFYVPHPYMIVSPASIFMIQSLISRLSSSLSTSLDAEYLTLA